MRPGARGPTRLTAMRSSSATSRHTGSSQDLGDEFELAALFPPDADAGAGAAPVVLEVDELLGAFALVGVADFAVFARESLR